MALRFSELLWSLKTGWIFNDSRFTNDWNENINEKVTVMTCSEQIELNYYLKLTCIFSISFLHMRGLQPQVSLYRTFFHDTDIFVGMTPYIYILPQKEHTLLNTISISIDISLSIIIPIVVSTSSSWLSGLDIKNVWLLI